jgi:acyl-CoA thioesterase-1
MLPGKPWKIVTFLGLIMLLTACGELPGAAETPAVLASNPTPQARLTILAIGDSLTEGFGVDPQDSYPSQLGKKLEQDGFEVQVINGGISGETSSAALTRLDWMLRTQPDIVIVETGGNDALRGVDLEVTLANIDEIVRRFGESGSVVIVAGLQIIQNLGSDYTAEFAAIYPEVAAKYDAILIPFVLEGVAADPELNQPDFIHPNALGYAVMVDHMYPYVLEAIKIAQTR